MFWVAPYMEVAIAKFYLSLLPEEEANNSSVDGGYVDVDGGVDDNKGANDFDAFDGGSDFKEDVKFSSDDFE